MAKLSIGRKILLGFFTLIIISASFLFISFPSLSKINILSSMVMPLSREINILQSYIEKVKHLETKTELYLTIRSEESREELAAALKEVEELAENQQNNNLTQLKEISNQAVKLTKAIETLVSYMDNQESTHKINLQSITVNKLFETFGQNQEVLQRERIERLQKITNQQKVIIDNLLDRFLIIEISIIIVGLLSSFMLSKLITRNLSKLQKATREIAAGNFQTRISISSKDEIGQLADSFNLMAENLLKTTVSKEYVDNIIRSMGESLIVLNPDLTISSLNKATCALLGYNEEELINKPMETIFPSKDASRQEPRLKNLIEGEELINCEAVYLTKDFRNVPILFRATPMKGKDGNIICVICTAADITERKQNEEKLKEAMEVKSKFTSMVSHELRTPLASIKTGINIVLDELSGAINAEQRDFLNIVRNNVDRLSRLINNILDFQKLESGRVQFKIEQNDINEIIKEISKVMHSMAKNKDIQFVLNLEENLPHINLDKDNITQVLSNLINNAIKFTEKGEIKIVTKKEINSMHVMIQDTGIGIKEEDIPKLFSAFTRVAKVKDKIIEGTGLGLVICKEIIEKHGGKIWVESEYNRGSTFHFTLPL